MRPARQTGPDKRASSASTTPTTLPSLLAVFAHPDDESLLAGGVLARHGASGARTAVVTTTWGPDSARAPELAAALSILGAGPPHMLGYSDARNESSAPGRPRLCDAPMDEVVGALVSHIRDFRPAAVVTHDALGQMTGHPDHRYTHQATLLAVEAAALGGLHRQRGAPWQTEAIYLATHTVSGGATLAAALSTVDKSALTVPDAYVSATADVSDWLAVKWQAVQAHQSQVAAPRSLPSLLTRMEPTTREEILRTEFYTRIQLTPTPPDATLWTL